MPVEVRRVAQLHLLRGQRLERGADASGAGEVLRVLLELVPQHESLAPEAISDLFDRLHAGRRRDPVVAVGEQVRGQHAERQRAGATERHGAPGALAARPARRAPPAATARACDRQQLALGVGADAREHDQQHERHAAERERAVRPSLAAAPTSAPGIASANSATVAMTVSVAAGSGTTGRRYSPASQTPLTWLSGSARSS